MFTLFLAAKCQTCHRTLPRAAPRCPWCAGQGSLNMLPIRVLRSVFDGVDASLSKKPGCRTCPRLKKLPSLES